MWNHISKKFCPHVPCHFLWLLRVKDRYGHIRLQGFRWLFIYHVDIVYNWDVVENARGIITPLMRRGAPGQARSIHQNQTIQKNWPIRPCPKTLADTDETQCCQKKLAKRLSRYVNSFFNRNILFISVYMRYVNMAYYDRYFSYSSFGMTKSRGKNQWRIQL